MALLSLHLFSCHSFRYKKKIADDYYLIGVDLKDYLSIDRKLNQGDYIGRIPAKILEYGIEDSFIVGKSEQKGLVGYYILNMQKDHDYAHEEDFLIGPLSEDDYNKYWHDKLKVRLKKPE